MIGIGAHGVVAIFGDHNGHRAAGLDLDHAVAMVRDRTKDRYMASHPDADPAIAKKFDRVGGAASNVSGIMYWLDKTEPGSTG